MAGFFLTIRNSSGDSAEFSAEDSTEFLGAFVLAAFFCFIFLYVPGEAPRISKEIFADF